MKPQVSLLKQLCGRFWDSTNWTKCWQKREKLSTNIQDILDQQTDGWGIKVTNVEMKQVDLDDSMVRAIASQAEAERERRAKVIHAEGELQASSKLLQSAQTLAKPAGVLAVALSADPYRNCVR